MKDKFWSQNLSKKGRRKLKRQTSGPIRNFQIGKQHFESEEEKWGKPVGEFEIFQVTSGISNSAIQDFKFNILIRNQPFQFFQISNHQFQINLRDLELEQFFVFSDFFYRVLFIISG